MSENVPELFTRQYAGSLAAGVGDACEGALGGDVSGVPLAVWPGCGCGALLALGAGFAVPTVTVTVAAAVV
jgi:hypothetical protein